MSRRQWKKWPSRFGKALADTSGVVGLVGVGITAVGATVAAPVVLALGGATIGGAVVYAGYRGIPPKMLVASELAGSNVSLDALKDIDPPILKLGIVGYTQSGKTTFLKQSLQKSPKTTRTSKVYAAIMALQTSPTVYVALLDGDGEQLPQQFEVAERADFLLVFMDHNQGDKKVAKSKERIEEHDRFLKQLEFHIKKGGTHARIHVVMNKRDLWEQSKSADELLKWFGGHVNQWERVGVAAEITSDVHSNIIAADIGKVIRLITESAEKL